MADNQSPNTWNVQNVEVQSNLIQPEQMSSGSAAGTTIISSGDERSSNYKEGSSGWIIRANGNVEFNNGVFRGDLVASEIHIPDENTTANSFHVETDGDTFWGCTHNQFISSPDNATAYILKNGAAKFKNAILTDTCTIAGRSAAGFNVVVDDGATPAPPTGLTATAGIKAVFLKWNYNTETDIDHYEVYRNTSDNRSTAQKIASVKVNMLWDSDVEVGTPYYYWLKVVDRIGNVSDWNAVSGVTATPRNVGTTDVEDDAITAAKINVNQLSAITADLGNITAGTFTLDSSGYIKTSGVTDYNNGIGIYLGYSTNDYKMHIGDPTGQCLKWDGTNLTVNDTQLYFQSFFGDGSDGNATITSNTSLSKDTFYNNLTISNSARLNTNGYRLFVRGTLTINSGCYISRNGNDGSNGQDGASGGAGGSGGTELTDGSIKGSVAGSAGGAGGSGTVGNAGTAGTNVAKSMAANGVAGGAGGNGYANGGAGGSAGTKTGTVYNIPRNAISAYQLYDFLPSGDQLKSSAGSGGGGGGGTGDTLATGGGGGGAGSPGGIVCVFARKIINNGTIEARGGNGGNGGKGKNGSSYGAGGGGGGGGGSGGVIILIYNSYSGYGTIDVSGGTGGTGGTGGSGTNPGQPGSAGTNGSSGTIITLQI